MYIKILMSEHFELKMMKIGVIKTRVIQILKWTHKKNTLYFISLIYFIIYTFCVHAGKTTMISTIAFQKTGGSQHHGGPIEDPPKTPRTIRALSY